MESREEGAIVEICQAELVRLQTETEPKEEETQVKPRRPGVSVEAWSAEVEPQASGTKVETGGWQSRV